MYFVLKTSRVHKQRWRSSNLGRLHFPMISIAMYWMRKNLTAVLNIFKYTTCQSSKWTCDRTLRGENVEENLQKWTKCVPQICTFRHRHLWFASQSWTYEVCLSIFNEKSQCNSEELLINSSTWIRDQEEDEMEDFLESILYALFLQVPLVQLLLELYLAFQSWAQSVAYEKILKLSFSSRANKTMFICSKPNEYMTSLLWIRPPEWPKESHNMATPGDNWTPKRLLEINPIDSRLLMPLKFDFISLACQFHDNS